MEYITEILNTKVVRTAWPYESELPMFLTEKYRFEQVDLDNIRCLFLQPRGELDTINTIKRNVQRLHEKCGYPVVLELPYVTRQRRNTLIGAKLPFVVPGKQIYLPFMGVLLSEKCDSEVIQPALEKLQPSAQMLLFLFILQKNKPLYLAPLAKQFGFSAMTITRAAQQLIATGYMEKTNDGVQKVLMTELTPEELYKKMQPYLINPVRKTVYIGIDDIHPDWFPAGLTALSEVSMLNPPQVKTWGTTKLRKDTALVTARLLDSEKQCEVQLWRYDPRAISQDDAIDILSLTASFNGIEDDRIEQCLDELMKGIW